MCGILGVICNEANFENEKKWLLKSIQALKHRGPDDRKIWISNCQKVLFGHTRLSIIDLNNQNAQPMFDAKSNVTISYNGEIYNFAEIKKNLSQKFNFVTSGDTEVVLKSYLEWGDDFIDKLEGMFSIAICDQRKKTILLTRDPTGQKPLFYNHSNKIFKFASELNLFDKKNLNIKNLNETLDKGFTFEKGDTLLENICEVTPGQLIKYSWDKDKIDKKNKHLSNATKSFVSKKDIYLNFDKILEKEILKHSQSDVKSCFCLSGGLDSSTITAVAKRYMKINTFSVTYDDDNSKINEKIHIDKMVNFLDSNHTEIKIENINFERLVKILEKFDIPILDSSIIPTFLLYEKIKEKNFKVAIGGDGADELFCGYYHYKIFEKLNFFMSIKKITVNNNFFSFLDNLSILNLKGIQYLRYFFYEKNFFKIPNFLNNSNRKVILKDNYFYYKSLEFELQNKFLDVNQIDFEYTLPFSLLQKIDRCSMLNSIEARSPYLSSNIINFVKTNLKKNDLYNNNKTKIFLKNYAKQILPKNFQFERKQGFSFHFDKFIKSKPNLIKIEQLLTNDNSIFKAEQVAKLLKLASNSLIKSEIVFAIFFFQIWINKNINKV